MADLVGGGCFNPTVDRPAEEDEGGTDRKQSGHDKANGLNHLANDAAVTCQDGREGVDHAG